MKKILILLTALTLVMWTPSVLATQTAAEPIQVTVFHTNDVHARVDTSAGMGYAMAAGFVNTERNAGKDVLLLDAGDTFHGMWMWAGRRPCLPSSASNCWVGPTGGQP
jgi:5'-nucleotidase